MAILKLFRRLTWEVMGDLGAFRAVIADFIGHLFESADLLNDDAWFRHRLTKLRRVYGLRTKLLSWWKHQERLHLKIVLSCLIDQKRIEFFLNA